MHKRENNITVDRSTVQTNEKYLSVALLVYLIPYSILFCFESSSLLNYSKLLRHFSVKAKLFFSHVTTKVQMCSDHIWFGDCIVKNYNFRVTGTQKVIYKNAHL